MARIAGVDLPRNKHINIALTYIYGIGDPRVEPHSGRGQRRAHEEGQDLSEDEVNRIRQVIEQKATWKAICAKTSRCTSSG